jgi:hypothetical protein
MKKIVLAVCALLFVGSHLSAQVNRETSNEFGFSTGFSSYVGDLVSSNMTYSYAGWANGIFYRHNFSSRVAAKVFGNYNRVNGFDHRDHSDVSRYNRNLSFRNDILELGVQAEINLFRLRNFGYNQQSGRRYRMGSPYVFAGINYFYHNPEGMYKGEWVALQPLTTEGVDYNVHQVAVPFGLGFKLQPTSRLSLGIEFGARMTFFDYLDDCSDVYPDFAKLQQTKGDLAVEMSYRGDKRNNASLLDPSLPVAGAERGNPNNNDWYTVTQISVAYRLGKK